MRLHQKYSPAHRTLSGAVSSVALSAAMLVLTLWTIPEARALDLLQSYQLALQQDASFQAAVADTEASRESEVMAFAQMLPNVSANLSRSRNDTNSLTPGPLGQKLSNTYQYSSSNYALTVRQPLYRKYSFAQFEQAQAQVAGAEASLDRSRQELIVRLASAYFEALLALDHRQLVLAQKETHGEHVKSAQKAFGAGVGTRTDIDEAQARHDMTLAQELEARQNVTYTQQQLQLIVNQPVDAIAALEPARMTLTSPMPAKVDEWIVRGEEVNPELRAMRANVDAAKQEVEKGKAGHLPTVDVVFQRSRSLSANDVTINQYYLSSQIGVQVSIPLFAGGYVDANVRQALASLEKNQQLYEAKRRTIGLQIRKEFQNVAEGVLKVRAMEQAERSANQVVLSTQKGFQAGTRTQVDILNAQQQRMNVRRDLAQTRYLYVLSRIRLLGLVGAIDEAEITTINTWLMEPGRGESSRAQM